jgi:DNA-binding NarL/FixJ family response regulator
VAIETYGIVLADDHVLVRQGLKRIINGTKDLEVIGEASDGIDLIELLGRVNPKMVIMDISMPRLRGIEAIPEIKRIRPEAKVLILTMHRDKEYLYLALSSGAMGYVLKEDADQELFTAIEKLRQGKTYVSPQFSDELLDDLVHVGKGEGKPSLEIDSLTPRERQIVKLIAEGRSSKEIGDLLFISPRTVENHRANIMEKLNIKRVVDLVKYAIRKGYVS